MAKREHDAWWLAWSNHVGEAKNEKRRCQMKSAVRVFVCIVLLLLTSCGEPGFPATEVAPSSTQTPLPPTATPIPPTARPATPTGTTPAAAPTSTMEAASPATPSSPAVSATVAVEVTRNVAYTKADKWDVRLDVYAPSEPGHWPVVVVVHGVMVDRSSLAVLARRIASRGAVVYNIDVNHRVPELTSAIERIACAVRFARDTADDYGGDPSWIALVGHSAGAHGGAVIALGGDDFAGECVVTGPSALVDAFVGYEGPYDWTTTVYHRLFDYTSMKSEDPELWRAVNPFSHIGRNLELQVRLIHGDAPDVEWSDIPLEASMEFHQALAEAGYDAELIVLEGATHAGPMSHPDVIAVTVEQVMELARGSSVPPTDTPTSVPPTAAATATSADGIWITRADMPTGRWDYYTCVVNEKIYAIGGAGPVWQALRTVEEYDPTTDTWTTKSEMSTARQGLSASVVNGKIYTIGGGAASSAAYISVETCSTVEEYDPATDTWTTKSDMPTARGFHSANVVDGKIYVIGGSHGSTPDRNHVRTVEVYDPATDTWTQKGDTPRAIAAGSSSVVDGKIYVFGGYGGARRVHEYDPATDTWTAKSEMPTARHALSTSALDGKIYAIGGYIPGVSDYWGVATVEVYDPATDTWTTAPDMPTARFAPRTSVVDGKIYAIGGMGHWIESAYGTVEEYNP